MFLLWSLDFCILDLRFGFLIKNRIFGQLERSGVPNFGPVMTISNFQKKSPNKLFIEQGVSEFHEFSVCLS